MSDIIQLLPDSVANQIAAGEVIQRPASVIKELVENAVDAGATAIDVVVVDAGRTLIQVIDNGKGMSETDARLSFERHATSKIRQADDLFALQTMGFRGEALASIAAVAQVELITRTKDTEIGTRLSIAGSTITAQEPCSCGVGANFKVENLFFNVPARRKFLKSNTTELNNIITAYQRIALVYPHIAFTLRSNGNELSQLRPGNLRQRIIDVFGKRLNQDLLPVKVETSLAKLEGFVGKPESARKKQANQYFFVNGRYMKHAYFAKAIQAAFERLVPVGDQVPFFIYFTVEPKNIDVNIHPTKTEIKFENEQAIWQILTAAVREAVGMFSDVTSIDFDTEGKPEIPVFSNGDNDIATPQTSFNPQYNPFGGGNQQGLWATKPSSRSTSQGSDTMMSSRLNKAPANWDALFSNLPSRQNEQQPQLFPDEEEKLPGDSPATGDGSPAHYQYKGRYVMTSVKSGLMVVDQHVAHIRVLYERFLARQEAHRRDSQRLVFPDVVELSANAMTTMEHIKPELEALGFELTPMGPTSYAINSVPADMMGVSPATLVSDMLQQAEGQHAEAVDAIRRDLALTMARHLAIPYGQALSNQEMDNLMSELFATTNVNYSPDGTKILAILPQRDIEQLFDTKVD